MPQKKVSVVQHAAVTQPADRRKPLRIKFTQAAVDRLNPPAEGRVDIWDTQLPGFGLRVSAPRPGQPARKSWQTMYRVRGRLIRETLGTLAVIPRVDDARALARASMTKAGRGIDPVAERKAAERDTLSAVLDRYLAKKKGRANYLAETRRTFDSDVRPALGEKAIGEVTRRDVRELLDAIVARGSPSHANHVLSYLRAALNWAVNEEIIPTNPAEGIKKPGAIVERDRALTDEEIGVLWPACDRLAYPFGPFLQLLLLTGQRRGELAGATWPEFDLEKALWTLPGERTKNGESHLVHLAPQAIEILAALSNHDRYGLLFTTTGNSTVSGWSVARVRLVKAMTDIAGKVPADFTIHDLRRTAASGMARIRIAPHVVDKILNHSTGKISGVARIYNRYEYLAERKLALDAWARHVEGLVKPGRGKVLARGRAP